MVLDDLPEWVVAYAAKLRKQDSNCTLLYMFLITNPFRTDLKQYCASMVVKLSNHSNSTMVLTKAALYGLKKIFKPGYQYKKAGVIIMGITPASEIQLSLFSKGIPPASYPNENFIPVKQNGKRKSKICRNGSWPYLEDETGTSFQIGILAGLMKLFG